MTRPAASFFTKIDDLNPDGCWPWRGEIRKPSGLPAFQKQLANRIMWEEHFGPVPEKSSVKTTCGLKHCVNPAHLTLGLLGKPQDGAAVRFWRFVNKTEGDGCWLWTGEPHTSGYGRIGLHDLGRGMEYAHRYSFELHFGAIPEEGYVAHRCDVKLCIRPEHLFLSDTNVQNMADAATKNRIAHGERAGQTLFCDEKIAEVRRMAQSGLTHQTIADTFGMSRVHVTNIVNRKTRTRDTTHFPDGVPVRNKVG